MTKHLKKFAFKSKADAVSRAKHFHLCMHCGHFQNENWKTEPCPRCGEKKSRQHFGSEREFKRGQLLLILFRAGKITQLMFQPSFDLKVNGVKITTYRADASYYNEENVFTVEDTKPEYFMTPEAKLKIKMFEAIFGMEVYIPSKKGKRDVQKNLKEK